MKKNILLLVVKKNVILSTIEIRDCFLHKCETSLKQKLKKEFNLKKGSKMLFYYTYIFSLLKKFFKLTRRAIQVALIFLKLLEVILKPFLNYLCIAAKPQY